MLFNIPNEILTLFRELETGLKEAIESGDIELANRFDRQLSNLAVSEISKELDRIDAANKRKADDYAQEQIDTAKTLGEGECQ